MVFSSARMLIRKDSSVTKMQMTNTTHELMSQGTQTDFPNGTTSLTNANERPSAPLENVSMYLSKFSVPDLMSSHTLSRCWSYNSSALVRSAISRNPAMCGLLHQQG